jgi:DNA-binding SARP family transcriptional activator
MKFSVLGPVRGWRGEDEVPLGSPQQRTLLAVLLLRRGHPAPVDELVAAIWDGEPPRAAVGTVRTYVSRLRSLLGDAGSGVELASVGGGYALRRPVDALDLDVFEQRLAVAQRFLRSGDDGAAAAAADEALALWSGPPLCGLDGGYATAQRARLAGLHPAAQEVRFAAEVGRDNLAATLVGDLAAFVDAYPLRERPRELLMLALCRAGRQAEALEVYHSGRVHLRDALGIDPGPSLRRLYDRILAADPDLGPTPVAGTAGPDARVATATGEAPMDLPPPLADFVGRAAELRSIVAAVGVDRAVVGVAGLDGVGRTATAVHAARQVADAFPDGILYADWATVTDPTQVLATWVRAVGVAPPAGASSCGLAVTLRRATAGRRVLAVVDNVEQAAHVDLVRAAVPSGSVLFTTRRRLPELPDATWVALAPLATADAVSLLTRLVGRHRVDAEPVAARRLVALVSGYPVPLRSLAARINARGRWSLAAIADQLAVELGQGGELRHEECVAAEAPFTRAYDRLTPERAAVFRMAAVLDAAEVSVDDVAALLDVPAHAAWRELDALVDVFLVEEAEVPGRYRYRGLVRGIARRHAGLVEGPEAVARALRRLAASARPLAAVG